MEGGAGVQDFLNKWASIRDSAQPSRSGGETLEIQKSVLLDGFSLLPSHLHIMAVKKQAPQKTG